MIAKLTIDKKKYILPLSWNDVTLKQFKIIQKFIDSEEVSKFYLEKKGDPTEEEIINYQIKFINKATSIPVNTLMKVNRFTNGEDIGIDDLFNSLTWLFIQPQENNKPLQRIGNYYFFDTSGIMKDNTLIEYTEANALNTALNGVEKDLEHLNLIMAIFYRPKVGWFKRKLEPYNIDKVKERAKEFDNVTMDIVFNAMFFFIQSKKDYLKSIEESLAVVLEKQYHNSKGIIGRFLSTILQKVEYLHRRMKMRLNRLIIRIYTKY